LAGGALDVAELLALAGGGPAASLAYRLREQRILATMPSRPRTLEICHDRIRETMLARISADRQRVLHRQVAHRLGSRPEVDPELLLPHLLGAGDDAGAASAAAEAGERAVSALAFGRAAELFELAWNLRGHRDADWPLAVQYADALSNA